MEFAILGPVEVRLDGSELALGGPKQRALLAVLLLAGNEVVSRDRLVEALWGDRAPPTAQRSLDSYLSRLRRLLGPERLVRRAPGYALRVEPEELDLDRFERLVGAGRDAAAAGDPARAARALGDALGLWRGPALADLLYEPFAARESQRLEEQRLGALEDRHEAQLALGCGPELVGELEAAVREHPLRERSLGQLMLALYRTGRHADALGAYRDARHRLASEPRVRARISAAGAGAADPPARPEPRCAAPIGLCPRPPRKPGRIAAAAAVVAFAAVAAAVVVLSGSSPDRGVGSGKTHRLVGTTRSQVTRLPPSGWRDRRRLWR